MYCQQRVLFIEDNKDYQDSLTELIEKISGYRVFKASTVEEAEKILQDTWVHLALVDLNMDPDDDSNSGMCQE
jgi:DNA-binding response OmpR family regulator